MKIESIIQNINISAVRGQIESSANNSSGANGSPNSKISGNASSPAAWRVYVALKEEIKDKQQNKDKQSTSSGNGLFALKAVFAIDKEKNVVIRFIDQNGKVVNQVPPEEYINMLKKFKENVENLFSKEV